MRLPGEYYESLKSMDFPVVESFDTDAEGRLYAATNDGFLIRLDLDKELVTVLGKPRIARRTRAMKVGADGNIYMVLGELERICKLYTLRPEGRQGLQRPRACWPSTAAPTTRSARTSSTRWRSARTARCSSARATGAASCSSSRPAPWPFPAT